MSSEPTPGDWQAQPIQGRGTHWWNIVVPASGYPGSRDVASYIENEADARVMAASKQLAVALRALVGHYDRFFVAVLGEELHAKTGDPAELAEARRVLADLDTVVK